MLLFFLTPVALLARATGDSETDQKGAEISINGFVTDAGSKKPVPGVTVSISTPKKQDKKEFVTDAAGNFKVPYTAASGGVTIVLEKKGYKTLRKEGVIIKEGETLKLSFDIDPDESGESIIHPMLRMMDGL